MLGSNQSTWGLIRNTIIVSLTILSFSQPLQATVPRASSGDLIVDQNGKANYQIPIVVPPGTANMQPTLALNLIGFD